MATPASAEPDALPKDAAARAVRELAADLLPSTREISQALVDHLAAALPEPAADEDEELREEILASCEANIDQVLRLPLEGYEPPEGVRVAFGGSGRDVAGFRRTHAEAMRAARLAALAGDSARP